MDPSDVTARDGPVVTIDPAARAALVRWAARLKAEAIEVKSIIGCDFEDIGCHFEGIDVETLRDLTMSDVIAQAPRGLRGRDALNAALAARVRGIQRALGTRKSSLARAQKAVSSARSRERSSRRTASAGSRGSPS